MSQKVSKKSPFVWDETKTRVAEAIAKGDRPQFQIATDFNINRKTIQRWQESPDFQLKISEIIADIDISMKSERIKIAKAEVKRLMSRLKDNEDKPGSRDLITALKYIGEETGTYAEQINIKGEMRIIQAPELRQLMKEAITIDEC